MRFLLVFTTFFSIANMSAQCWNLVWEDEFNGSSLDLTKWEYMVGGDGWGNNELQYYTNGSNITVSGGTLKITAAEDTNNTYPDNDYTSSRLRSIYKGDFRYGRLEASMKMPDGQGFWPAFWMMPTYSEDGGWPRSGEIDIMEYLGHQNSTAYGFSHYGFTAQNKSSSGTSVSPSSGTFTDSFHTFSIEWEPGQIQWKLDGVVFHTLTDAHSDFNTFFWPFDQQFHFILNLAVGGNWPGAPDGTTMFPADFEIDYVRVYQQNPDILITGDRMVQPGESNVSYSVPNVSGATYSWSVPANASIISGQGTSEIMVNWSAGDGSITCNITTACGSVASNLVVNVTPNRWDNYGFESYWNYWYSNTFDGATADFVIGTGDSQEGDYAICVTTTNLAGDPWDIQLTRPSVNIVSGEEYTLSFWAKADAAGKDADVAIINNSTFAYYAGSSFSLTTSWTNYTYTFIAPTTATCLFNWDWGDELGTFCIDNASFALTSLLPVELQNFWLEKRNDKSFDLGWKTVQEINLSHFELQWRSNEIMNWKSIVNIPSKGNESIYHFTHQNPRKGENYYRLKSVDHDGAVQYSSILNGGIDDEGIRVFPNPVVDELSVLGEGIERIELYHLDGTFLEALPVEQDIRQHKFSLGKYLKGNYYIYIIGKNITQVKRIAKL